MKSEWEAKEKSTGDLKATVDGEEWKKAQDKAFRKIARSVRLDGFRQGKAPEAIVRRRVSSQAIYEEAIDMTANKVLQDAMEEQKITLVDRPTLDVPSVDGDQVVMVFHCVVEPEVKLGDYKGLEYTKEKVKATAQEVKDQLEAIRRRYTEQVVKENGTVEKGDVAEIDYEGFRDGVPFEGGKGTNYPLEIGSGMFIPGFEDQLIGMKAGEEKDVKVTFPENYSEKSLAGQPVVFKVKVNDVKQNVVPELNDDLAKDLDEEGVETLKDLEKKIKKEIEDRKEKEAEEKAKGELLKKAGENASVEIPQAMIDREKDYMLNDFKSRIQGQGIPFEKYVRLYGKTVEEVRDEIGRNAPERVKSQLVLKAVAKAESIDPSGEDVEKEYQKLAENSRMKVEDVKKWVSAEDLKEDLRLRQAMDFLYREGKPVEPQKEKPKAGEKKETEKKKEDSAKKKEKDA